ncbi:unnamed protein product, partial [Rotaria magnacalcarata]
RIQAMSLYVQSTNREREIFTDEIKHIIEEFKHYNELQEKRLNLEVEQSIYFLEVQRVEGEIKEQEEEIIAPTLTRSLGEDFSLQL